MILLNMIEKEKQKGVNNEVVENIKQNDKEIIQSMVNVS